MPWSHVARMGKQRTHTGCSREPPLSGSLEHPRSPLPQLPKSKKAHSTRMRLYWPLTPSPCPTASPTQNKPPSHPPTPTRPAAQPPTIIHPENLSPTTAAARRNAAKPSTRRNSSRFAAPIPGRTPPPHRQAPAQKSPLLESDAQSSRSPHSASAVAPSTTARSAKVMRPGASLPFFPPALQTAPRSDRHRHGSSPHAPANRANTHAATAQAPALRPSPVPACS